MRRLLVNFLADEAGFVTSPEWALAATVLVLGALTGLIATQQAGSPDTEPPALVSER
jgi:hypothetical protein